MGFCGLDRSILQGFSAELTPGGSAAGRDDGIEEQVVWSVLQQAASLKIWRSIQATTLVFQEESRVLLVREQNETAWGSKIRLSLAPLSGEAGRAKNPRFS